MKKFGEILKMDLKEYGLLFVEVVLAMLFIIALLFVTVFLIWGIASLLQ